eukprot:Awhi_evm2s11853
MNAKESYQALKAMYDEKNASTNTNWSKKYDEFMIDEGISALDGFKIFKKILNQLAEEGVEKTSAETKEKFLQSMAGCPKRKDYVSKYLVDWSYAQADLKTDETAAKEKHPILRKN